MRQPDPHLTAAAVTRVMPEDEESSWQNDMLFLIGSRSWLIHLRVVALTAVVLTRGAVERWIVVWGAVMVATTLGLALLSRVYRNAPRALPEAERFGKAHGFLTAIIGLTWGIGAFFVAQEHEIHLFYALMLGGTALGAVSTQHPRQESCRLSIWTSLPLLSAAQLAHEQRVENVAAAGTILLYGVALTVMCARLFRFLSENRKINELLAEHNAQLALVSEELREAQDVRLRFLAQASHDLRQPIHAMGLFVEFLKSAKLTAEETAVLGNIDRSLGALTRLCRSLLDLSALDVGRVKPAMSEFPLMGVIADVLRQAEEQARQSAVQLRAVPTGVWVKSDPALLHNMLQNVVSNAVKYAPEGKVLVGLRRTGGSLAIDVVDQGAGLSQEDQNHMFGEFVRLDRKGEKQIDGLGLGLSIVRRLAAALNLRVAVRSRPGRGTRFRISGFERVAPRPMPPRRHPHGNQLEGMKVMVVDDDETVRESTTRILVHWGCDVQTTGEFPDDASIAELDFLICDHELEQSMGLERLVQAKARMARDVPAAIVTGFHDAALQEAAEASGITVLLKPVRPAQLRSLLLAARTR